MRSDFQIFVDDHELVEETMTQTVILRLPAVRARVGLGKTKLYDLVKSGEFPAPIQLSKRAVGWRSDHIDQWLKSRPPAATREKTA